MLFCSAYYYSYMMNNQTPFIFFGTPAFAVGILDELEKNGLIPSLVVTGLDKPKGRKLILTKPEAKVWAEKRNIPVLQLEKLDDDAVEKLKIYNSPLFVVAAYGKLIPNRILELPKLGTINVHPSLLPKLRGASPLQSAILSENKTGVSIMLIDDEMDHGPILAQEESISWENNLLNLPKSSVLQDMLAKIGGRMLSEVIPKYVRNEIVPVVQNHVQATYTKKISKDDGLLNFEDNMESNYRKIKAFDVWPRAYFFQECHEKQIRVIVTDATIKNNELVLMKVIPEGGKEMPYEEFLHKCNK